MIKKIIIPINEIKNLSLEAIENNKKLLNELKDFDQYIKRN